MGTSEDIELQSWPYFIVYIRNPFSKNEDNVFCTRILVKIVDFDKTPISPRREGEK